MKHNSPIISRNTGIVVGICLLLLLVTGSFLDYPLSQALYNEQNPIGIFFAAYGECPAMFGLIAAGTMLVIASDHQKKWLGILQMLGGVFLTAAGVVMSILMPAEYLSWSKAVIASISIVLALLVIYGTYRLCKDVNPVIVRRVALVMFLVIFADIVVVNLIKIPWGRPRMRLIASNPDAYFLPWWQPGTGLKDSLVALGVDSDEFKSFPSGHSANASSMMLLSVLPWLKPEWKKYQNHLLGFGMAWAVIVAFTRIVMGAHFLTDVTVGLTIGFLVFALATRLLPKTE